MTESLIKLSELLLNKWVNIAESYTGYEQHAIVIDLETGKTIIDRKVKYHN